MQFFIFFFSLQNMYKELIDDIPGFSHPGHGTLIGWANQGKSKNSYVPLYYCTTMKFNDLITSS